MYKSKHLPLLALALLVSSTELRAEESQLPFKVGDELTVVLVGQTDDSSTLGKEHFRVTEIKGKWVLGNNKKWYNSDHFLYLRNNPSYL